METALPLEIWVQIRLTHCQLYLYGEWQRTLGALLQKKRARILNWTSRDFHPTEETMREGFVLMEAIKIWWFHDKIAMITSPFTYYMLGGGDRRLFIGERYSFFIIYQEEEENKAYDDYLDKVLRDVGGCLDDLKIDAS